MRRTQGVSNDGDIGQVVNPTSATPGPSSSYRSSAFDEQAVEAISVDEAECDDGSSRDELLISSAIASAHFVEHGRTTIVCGECGATQKTTAVQRCKRNFFFRCRRCYGCCGRCCRCSWLCTWLILAALLYIAAVIVFLAILDLAVFRVVTHDVVADVKNESWTSATSDLFGSTRDLRDNEYNDGVRNVTSSTMYEASRSVSLSSILPAPPSSSHRSPLDRGRYCGSFMSRRHWTDTLPPRSLARRPLCMDFDGTLVDSTFAFGLVNDHCRRRSGRPGCPAWRHLNRPAPLVNAYIIHRPIAFQLLTSFVAEASHSQLYVFVDRCSNARSDLTADIEAVARRTLSMLERELGSVFVVREKRSIAFESVWMLETQLATAATSFVNVTLVARFVICCERLGVPSCADLAFGDAGCGHFVSSWDKYLDGCARAERPQAGRHGQHCSPVRISCPNCPAFDSLGPGAREQLYEAAYVVGGVLADPRRFRPPPLLRVESSSSLRPVVVARDDLAVRDYPIARDNPAPRDNAETVSRYVPIAPANNRLSTPGRFCETLIV